MNKKETLEVIAWVLVITASSYTAGKIAGNEARKGVFLDVASKQIEDLFIKACPAERYRFLNSTTTEMKVECIGKNGEKVNFIPYNN